MRAISSANANGLAEIVVGAGVEAGDAVLDRAARGEDQHRRADAGLAQAAQQLAAVRVRQTEVEDDQIVGIEQQQAPGVVDASR